MDLPSRSDDEIRALAVDVIEGKVFGSWMVPHEDSDLLGSIFMVLNFLDLDGREDIGHVYEYLGEAGGRGVNGYPSFMSIRYLNKEECRRLADACVSYKVARSSFLSPR